MKILIVDDIKGWRDYHKFVLKNIFPNADYFEAESAREGYDLLLSNNSSPFEIILTDLQMENDFEPKYSGEWFVEQIKSFKTFDKSKIVIISAAYNIEFIAKSFNVNYIRKSTARNFPEAYEFLKN